MDLHVTLASKECICYLILMFYSLFQNIFSKWLVCFLTILYVTILIIVCLGEGASARISVTYKLQLREY